MLTLNQYSIKYSINIHTLRSWVKRDKIDGAELKNKRWFIPDAPLNNDNAPVNNPINATALELLIKEKDERIASLEHQIQNLQEQNKKKCLESENCKMFGSKHFVSRKKKRMVISIQTVVGAFDEAPDPMTTASLPGLHVNRFFLFWFSRFLVCLYLFCS